MSDIYNIEQTYSDRKRAQLRLAAEVIGVDEVYLSRMLNFFAARVNADKRLGQVCGDRTWDEGRAQVERMTAFWVAIALHTGKYSGNLVDVHRHLPGIRREDFERWLDLFRATLKETAPTPAAANYLMARTERVARYLEAEIFEAHAHAAHELPGHRRVTGQS